MAGSTDLTAVPAALRSANVRPLVARGTEVEKYALQAQNVDQHRVSYYCFVRAMEKAVASGRTGEAEVQAYLLALMQKLEAMKQQLGIDAASADHDKELVMRNALTVFKKADDVDRAGAADKSTARNYNVAANFFDVLTQFGELDEETVQMRKYAQFKALDILAALKEGRRPTPGVPGASSTPPAPDGGDDEDVTLPDAGLPPAPTGMPMPAPYPPAGGLAPPSPVAPPAAAPTSIGYAPMPGSGSYAPVAPAPAPAAAAGYSMPPSAPTTLLPVPSVPPTTVPAGEAVAGEESACVAKSTRVHFRSDAMHDAWKVLRSAVRALEMDDASTALKYMGQSQGFLVAAGHK